MNIATIKTGLKYLASFFRKIGPWDLSASAVEGIYNYRRINDHISTSGQPTAKQFEAIKAAGFETVINLAPHGVENALPDEAGTLAALDLDYVHIPVDFKAPSEQNFADFVSRMKALNNRPVWVHCAANMRVSAFIYRYRTEILGDEPETTLKDLHPIWEPFGVWAKFIAS